MTNNDAAEMLNFENLTSYVLCWPKMTKHITNMVDPNSFSLLYHYMRV